MGTGQIANAITGFPDNIYNPYFGIYNQIVFALGNQAGLFTIARVTTVMCEYWEQKKERMQIEKYGMIENGMLKPESWVDKFKYKLFR